MGLSEHWVALRVSATGTGSGAEQIEAAGLSMLGEHQGWVWARGWPEGAETDELVSSAASGAGEPCIGALVFDSDFGYVVGSAPDGTIEFQLAVNEPYEDEDELTQVLAEQWNSPEQRAEAAQGVSSWSERFAPAAIPADRVLHALRDDENTPEPGMGRVFADEALREIFDGMGFPSLDQTVFLPDH